MLEFRCCFETKWNLLKQVNGAPREIRTPDQPVRSRLLYPAELWARIESWILTCFGLGQKELLYLIKKLQIQ